MLRERRSGCREVDWYTTWTVFRPSRFEPVLHIALAAMSRKVHEVDCNTNSYYLSWLKVLFWLFEKPMRLKLLFSFFLFLTIQVSLLAQVEICDNGLDDDGDGLVDLNDSDCACPVIAPISYIPNPSFEDTDCCPNNRSQLNCATGWIQASEATTDYLNTCDYLGWPEFPPPRPFPDGNGIVGFRDGRVSRGSIFQNWKEYAGACLLQPLLADSFYRFQFDVGFVNSISSPPITITFYGTTLCENLPFGLGNEDFGCPSNDPNWKILGEVRVSGGGRNVWVNTFIDIVPDEDISAIAIGPACAPAVINSSLYYYFDNLTLAELSSFNLRISETAHPCNEDVSLTIPSNPGFQYQWYLDGVALVGEVSSDLSQLYGEGSYEVRILDGARCRVSSAFEYRIPVVEEFVYQTICAGEELSFGEGMIDQSGVYYDTLKNQNNCDSIVRLELTVVEQLMDTVVASIFAGETYPVGGQRFGQEGRYPVLLESAIGCDSLVLLDLTTFELYIPTAFSPNGDSVNDVFRPFAQDDRIVSLSMKIYDRWGGLLSLGTTWDGGVAAPGVYVYLIDVVFSDGTVKTLTGDVSLMR